MCTIATYVFFDIETTGLPWQEKNRTKITELSFVVALRKDILTSHTGSLPPVSKLTLVFNPGRPINPEVVQMNGLSNDLLRHAPPFEKKIDTIVAFLNELPKPVCLVAHNGNRFDFKILQAEFCDANMALPNDLLCVDSLVGFRQILDTTKNISVTKPQTISIKTEDLLTDDDDDNEWPDLNVSTEEWKDIDEICESLSDLSCEDINEVKRYSVKKQNVQKGASRNQVIGKVFGNTTNVDKGCEDITKDKKNSVTKINRKKRASRSEVIENVFRKTTNVNKGSFTLISIYKRLLKKDLPYNHHRAEDDCFMLLECVLATKDEFMQWADKACTMLTDVKPLKRY